MGTYSKLYWSCPFYKWDERLKIHCEGNRIAFHDQKGIQDYANQHCASPSGWKNCSIAKSLLEYYERKEQSEKHRQDQKPRS